MRDQFITLSQCYLTLRDYDAAREATGLAQLLEKFEEDHDITEAEWPPRLADDPFEPSGKALAGTETSEHRG